MNDQSPEDMNCDRAELSVSVLHCTAPVNRDCASSFPYLSPENVNKNMKPNGRLAKEKNSSKAGSCVSLCIGLSSIPSFPFQKEKTENFYVLRPSFLFNCKSYVVGSKHSARCSYGKI